MEALRQSLRYSLYLDTREGNLCRQILCALLLLLSCRWWVVVWQVAAIMPLPFVYGISLLPGLTLGGVTTPILCNAGDGGGGSCGCLCSARSRQAVSVFCAVLDCALSIGLSGGLVYGVDKLAMEPDMTLNVYLSGMLHSFVFVLVASILASLLYTALAVQGHCCTKHNIYSFDSCVHHTTELNPGSASERNLQQSLIDEVEEDFGLADAASGIARPKDVSIKCICPKRSGKCMLSAAFLLIYSAVTFFQLLVFLVGLWQWQMKTGLRHTNGGDDSPPCGDPLVGNYAPCALPFPSDYLLEPDPPSATRYRVAMTSKSIPLSRWDGELSPAAWNAQDGFSTVSPVLFAFAPKDKVPIDASCLISHANIEKSMDATKPAMTTILLDADSGELVPHWVDMDQYHLNYGDDMAADGRPPLLILQPAKPLRHNTTYIVGVRGLTAKGVAVPAEAAFKAVRDCVPPQCDPSAQLANGNPAIQWPKERTHTYNSLVFPRLETSGFSRSDLQLAWWYKTVSSESSLGVAKHIRDQSLASVPLYGQPLPSGQSAIEPVVDQVIDYTCKADDDEGGDDSWGGPHGVHIGRTVWGHFMAPTYLRHAGPGYHTFFNFPSTRPKGQRMDSRDDPAGHSIGGVWWNHEYTDLGAGGDQRSSGDGARAMPVRLDRDERVNWVARIPCSVLHPLADGARSGPAFVMQYGHGLFGDRAEIRSGYLSKIANENEWILVALDWAGMSRWDVPQTIRILSSRFDEFASMPQRTVQGWAYNAMLMRLLGTEAMAKLPAFRTSTGVALLSPSHYADGAKTARQALEAGDIRHAGPLTAAYYGNSQGSVVGCGYCAYQRDIRRCTCGVPGCPFALILSRSKDFLPFYMGFQLQFTHAQDIRLAITLMQMLWDQGESGGWLAEMAPKQVLLQAGIGDAQVNNLGAEIMARAYNASTVKPQTRPVYNVPERESNFDGSGFVEWLYDDVPDSPPGDVPRPDDKDVHECPRREPAGQRQMALFFEGRNVTQQCHDRQGHRTKCESKHCPSDYGPWPGSPTPLTPGG